MPDAGKMSVKVVPHPGPALDLHRAVVPADDALHRGEPEPTTGELRREERIEDPVPGGFVHARPGVDDLEERVAALGELARQLVARQVAPGRRRPVRERTVIVPFASPIASEAFVIRLRITWRSWVASASIVGVSRAKSSVSSAFLRDRGPEQRVQAGHRARRGHDLDDERPLAGVREHLPRQVGAARRGQLDLLQRRPGASPRRAARRARCSCCRGSPSAGC